MRSVSTALGARQLTVMPSGPISPESVLAMPVTAARTLLDSTSCGRGWRTLTEVTMTIRPWSDCLR